ncbi:PQQ-dependent sugar dehydrogenase [Halobacillus yeomjeoni]|uniref:PQQ-dependent sugar dehydrogenase n=1 Tax=Halobacillus yeomjeoni TaxID=311194 RepID=UPI001CD42453|nr:PQQ-dependent sugar dehydrogenase [Halobacillus yeomjeoni]MCA0985335.1 PQQ-dependent sugar dehydrogenase [Halobacillus yeomjeoni]
MKKSLAVIGVLLFFVLVACSDSLEENENKEASFQKVVEELQSPWDIEYSESTFYITEREGSIVSWDGENKLRMNVDTSKPVLQQGEGGLLGMKLHPDFKSNHQAVIYHTYADGEQIKNRVVLVEKQEETWVEKEILIENIPGARFHNGGRIELGPDQSLYITTGDALDEELAQDKSSLAGKVLRVNLDGSPPEDNPMQGSYIYSYGHRNPQGLAWAEDGTLYASEHGPDAHDEINVIRKGENYGWPLIKGNEKGPELNTPYYHTGKTTWAPSGISVHNGKLYVAALRGESVKSISLNNKNIEIVTDNFGRVRDVEVVNDILYFITNNTDGRGAPESSDDVLVKFNQK